MNTNSTKLVKLTKVINQLSHSDINIQCCVKLEDLEGIFIPAISGYAIIKKYTELCHSLRGRFNADRIFLSIIDHDIIIDFDTHFSYRLNSFIMAESTKQDSKPITTEDIEEELYRNGITPMLFCRSEI